MRNEGNMQILSIIAHPRSDSFCHAVSERARAALAATGHEIVHHDLYAERFDPCLSADEAYTVGDTLERALSRASDPVVARHRADISTADALLVVHPNWWGKPPAILAGWLDRILVPGVAYRLAAADGLPEGLLSVRRALILNTSDTPAERELADLGDPLDLIWRNCVLRFCGVTSCQRRVFRPVVGSPDAKRQEWLDETEALCRTFLA
jgi:putative NADPH-quinone reductase